MTRAPHLAEIGAPGAVIGVLAGAVVAGLSVVAGHPVGWALVSAVTLGVPLALLGAGYGVVVALGRFRPGVFAPAALYWMVGFPLARLVHETGTPVVLGGSPTPPGDILGFLVFQALISMGFAIGFIWLFERITPPWLISIKEHNPVAERLYGRYAEHAEAMWEAREARRARRRAAGSSRPAAATGAPTRGRSRRST